MRQGGRQKLGRDGEGKGEEASYSVFLPSMPYVCVGKQRRREKEEGSLEWYVSK